MLRAIIMVAIVNIIASMRSNRVTDCCTSLLPTKVVLCHNETCSRTESAGNIFAHIKRSPTIKTVPIKIFRSFFVCKFIIGTSIPCFSSTLSLFRNTILRFVMLIHLMTRLWRITTPMISQNVSNEWLISFIAVYMYPAETI